MVATVAPDGSPQAALVGIAATEHARDPQIVHVRVRPRWLRYSDYRAGSVKVMESRLDV